MEKLNREYKIKNEKITKQTRIIKTSESFQPIKIHANINPSEYLQIPETNFIIVEYEPDWTKWFSYENSHRTVLQKGFEMPTPALFMPHFVNVVNAYHHTSQLYDAAGNEVTGDRLNRLYKRLTKNCWSWLNAKFVDGFGFQDTDLETITGLDTNGNLVAKREPLEPCLWEDCYVKFKFNKQGLAMSNVKSREQEYKQGENIYFYSPRKNYIARFMAGSCRAGLYCDWYPYSSVASLGVFCVCEINVRQ